MTSDEAHSSKKSQGTLTQSRLIHKSKSILIRFLKSRAMVIFLFFILICFYAHSLDVYHSSRLTKTGYVNNIQPKKQILSEKDSGLSKKYDQLLNEYETLKKTNHEMLLQNEKMLLQLNELKKENEELSKTNKELTKDNIALQNSLKIAASVGIKPQNFMKFDGITRGEVERGKYAGTFLGTAYTPSVEECGNDEGITHSGIPIIPGVSIAVDTKYWPIGTLFYIRGLGYAVAMDTGAAIKGKYRFDFAVFDKKFADELGVRYWDMYVIEYGKGKISNIRF